MTEKIKPMTKVQVARHMGEMYHISAKDAKNFIDDYIGLAIAETQKKGIFTLHGIGKLVKVDRKARMGRNPATGESIQIPAKKVVKFSLAKSCKDAIVPPKK